jgi:hypothetical protein
MDDGLEFQYAENEDVDEEVVVKNKRGKGKAWRPVVIYHNMVAAKASIRDDDTRVIGRINRGSTVASPGTRSRYAPMATTVPVRGGGLAIPRPPLPLRPLPRLAD